MKKALSVIFSCILSLFMAILVLGGCLCAFAKETVCDPQLLIDCGNTSSYTDELYDEIKYEWENLLSVTGITDMEPILQILTPEVVKEAAIGYLTDAYTGTAEIDTQSLHDTLEEKVRNYANSNNIHATPQAELDKNINDLVNACISEFTNSVRIPLLPRLLGKTQSLVSYLDLGIKACAVGAALLLLFLFFLQTKRTDTLYYAAIATATDAVVMLGAVWAAGHYGLTDRLPIDVSALRTLLVSYVNALLENLQRYGNLLLLATAALLALYILIVVVIMVLRKVKTVRTPKEA